MPEIGNVGVNDEDMESLKAHCKGVFVRQYQPNHSSFRAQEALHTFLEKHGVMGICDIDTRYLTKMLRNEGAMMMVASTQVSVKEELKKILENSPRIEEINYIDEVSTKVAYKHTSGTYDPFRFCYNDAPAAKAHIVALDFGIKRNILNELTQAGFEVEVLPNSVSGDELIARYDNKEIDGVFLSNGPGDPLVLKREQEEIKKVIYDDMIAIKEGLDNLDNKDYVDRLLPVLEKELDYYVMFIDIGTGIDDTEELNKYFDNINKFLIQYKELYDEYIQYNKKELIIKEQELTKKEGDLSKNKSTLKAKEGALKKSKKELEQKQEELNNIKKAKDEEDEKAQNGTETQASLQPVQEEGQAAGQSGGDGEPGEEADGEAGGEPGVEADGEAEETDYDNKIDALKNKIKVNKDQYSTIIKEIREVKICINGLDKDIEKINKRIDVIKKKIKQYEEFSEKIVILSNKIKDILKLPVLDRHTFSQDTGRYQLT
jgi:hypothetical protein